MFGNKLYSSTILLRSETDIADAHLINFVHMEAAFLERSQRTLVCSNALEIEFRALCVYVPIVVLVDAIICLLNPFQEHGRMRITTTFNVS